MDEIHPRFLQTFCSLVLSGADRDRTGDPLVANQVLSQLSYRPLRLHNLTAPTAKRRSAQTARLPNSAPARQRNCQTAQLPDSGLPNDGTADEID